MAGVPSSTFTVQPTHPRLCAPCSRPQMCCVMADVSLQPWYFAAGNKGSCRGAHHVTSVPLRCLFLPFQQSPSLRMDQWQQQRLRQQWCEGQVTASSLPGTVSRHGGLPRAVGGGWDGVALLGFSLCSFAASFRFHPQSHRWISGHHQPWADGRALWSRQPGLRGQQLHQRCQSSPEHWLWPQPRGECSSLGSSQGEGLHLCVVMEASSVGSLLSC